MKPLSIRSSLTLWFCGLTALLLSAFAVTLYFGVRGSLLDGIDTELMARAEGLVALCEWEEDEGRVEFDLAEELAQELGVSATRRVEVRTWPKSRLLHGSGGPIPVALPAAATGPANEPLRATIRGRDGSSDRLCTVIAHVPAVAPDPPEPATPGFDVIVRVSDSLAPVESQLAGIAWIVASLAAGALVVVLAFGFWLSRRFVQPLRQLNGAAARVREGARAEMPRRGTGDEVDNLAVTIEQAFAALRDALDRQTRFTADAAHELRNPISVIHSAADIALRHERTPAEYAEFLEDVLATAKHMGSVVDGLLVLARTDTATAHVAFDDVDLTEVAEHAAAARSEANPGRIVFNNGVVASVRGARDLLRILIDNLLSNALRHADADEPVEISVERDADGITLAVSDHGPGISDEDADRLFERFYRAERANPNQPGAGLGLSIVAAIAELHGASCTAEPQPHGARFAVRFPRATTDG